MSQLLELAKDAYEKAKIMYETATNIAEKLEHTHPTNQITRQQAKNEVKG